VYTKTLLRGLLLVCVAAIVSASGVDLGAFEGDDLSHLLSKDGGLMEPEVRGPMLLSLFSPREVPTYLPVKNAPSLRSLVSPECEPCTVDGGHHFV